MSRLDEQSWLVVAAAQRYISSGNPSELSEFDLALLKRTDYQLGNRDINTGWRKAIQDLIKEKENAPEILEVSPEVFGIKLNMNEFVKRVFRRFNKQ